MKKIALLLTAAIAGISLAGAQDFQKATELAKQANEALTGGNAQTAIELFQTAATEASQCSEEGAAGLVESCKIGLAQSYYSYANTLIEEGKLDEAIGQLSSAAKVATEVGEEELVEKAEEKTTQLHQAIANAKIKAAGAEKDAASKLAKYKEAIQHLDDVIAKEVDNAKAYLQKGQVLSAINDKAQAVESYMKAAELGMADAANKQLSTIFLKEAASKLKAKDLKGALSAALKSNEYLESANAYKIAGTAANALKDIPAAENYLSKYLELAPNAKDAEQIKAAVTALRAALKK